MSTAINWNKWALVAVASAGVITADLTAMNAAHADDIKVSAFSGVSSIKKPAVPAVLEKLIVSGCHDDLRDLERDIKFARSEIRTMKETYYGMGQVDEARMAALDKVMARSEDNLKGIQSEIALNITSHHHDVAFDASSMMRRTDKLSMEFKVLSTEFAELPLKNKPAEVAMHNSVALHP
jgi:hypothetical protein